MNRFRYSMATRRSLRAKHAAAANNTDDRLRTIAAAVIARQLHYTTADDNVVVANVCVLLHLHLFVCF